MLANEARVRELIATTEAMKKIINEVNDKANQKIDQMTTFVQEVEGRFSQLERSLPERIHIVEQKSENFVTMINQMTGHLQTKFREIEDALKIRHAPPIPPSFGGASRGAEQFGIGSPLSGPEAQPDPWFAFAQSRTAYSSGPPAEPKGYGPSTNPQPPPSPSPPTPAAAGPSGLYRPFDSREWNAVDIKVAKEL